MHIPRFMRHLNRVLTNPVLGTFAWLVPPLAVVHHVGRKSGRAYRTPVVAFRSDAGVVIHACAREGIDCAFIGRVLPREAGVTLRVGRQVRELPQFPQDEITRLFA